MRRLTPALALAMMVTVAAPAQGAWDDRPTWQKVGYTILAGIQNVVPVSSALAAPRCLPGYVVCKLSFAGLSLLAAGEQFAFSGGTDLEQTRAILQRGFGGDWYLTGAHSAGDVTPEVLPEAGPRRGPDPDPAAGSGS